MPEKKLEDLLGKEKCERLLSYMEDVLSYNEKVNLTAIKDRDEFIEKHLLDSLSLLALPEYARADRVLDLGTGGGFPGVPLAIASPEKTFVLCDALRKRIDFIAMEKEKLGIENVQPVHGRAEELGRMPEYRESFDLCVSRAVAEMRVLSEYCLPFVKIGGSFVAFKGPKGREELALSERAVQLLGGGEPRLLDAFRGEQGEERELSHLFIVIPKLRASGKKYPRKAGSVSKDPL